MGVVSERQLDALWAVSFAGCAAAGLRHAPTHALPVAAGVAALHVVACVLMSVRRRARRHGSHAQIAKCLPSFCVALLVGALAPAPGTWGAGVVLLFLVGAAVAVISLASLGRSFAVLPALRSVVTTGPYGIVRHPAYLGEILMLAACALTLAPLPCLLMLGAIVLGFAWRMRAEEAVLQTSRDYARYKRRVAYRLVPGLW